MAKAKRGRKLGAAVGGSLTDRQALIRWLDKQEKAAERELLNGEQILFAVGMCLRSGLCVPPHLATEFCERHIRFKAYRYESLDQAFDISRKGEQLHKQREFYEKVAAITKSIVQRSKAGEAIGEGIYEAVAEELHLPYSRVKRIYERGLNEMYWVKFMCELFDEEDDKSGRPSAPLKRTAHGRKR